MKQNYWNRKATRVKPLNNAAAERETDMDRYWQFCYEVLSYGSLSGQWRSMKQAGVSFIRKGLIGGDEGISSGGNTK